MLDMGFIPDIERIFKLTPFTRQTLFFSATMPPEITRLAQAFLQNPKRIEASRPATAASTIEQRIIALPGGDPRTRRAALRAAMTGSGEVKNGIVFCNRKTDVDVVALSLKRHGFNAAPIHGDLDQSLRTKTLDRFRSGELQFLIASDVAARGLDIPDVSHVFNYEPPRTPDDYVHRIGRTGRAGRSGEAILFIAPRERNMLRVIERATRQAMEEMALPTIDDVNDRRVARFHERISTALAADEGEPFRALIERYEREHNVTGVEIAAALASIAQGKKPLLLDAERTSERTPERTVDRRPERTSERRPERTSPSSEPRREQRYHIPDGATMDTYRIEVGRVHGVQPGNIVGAIANEAGIDGKHIGRVVIRDDHSFVDLPAGMPKELLGELRNARVAGQKLEISRALKSHAAKLRQDRESASRDKRPRRH
jgi:ATP-dependent RNA helicase DeaD